MMQYSAFSPTGSTGMPTLTFKAFVAWKCHLTSSSGATVRFGNLSAVMTALGMRVPLSTEAKAIAEQYQVEMKSYL